MSTKDKAQEQEVTGLFAFWRYDLYPYVTGAPITKMNDDGLVYAPSYQGWFAPIKLMPLSKGVQLLDAMTARPHGLVAQRERAFEEFEQKWDETLFVLFPDARHPNIARHQKEKKR